MKNKKDYYRILDVRPASSPAEIRQAYRRLASLTHPDRDSSPQATRRMQEINEAYGVLGNENKRIKYDIEYRTADISSKKETTPVPNTKVVENSPPILTQIMEAIQFVFAALIIIELLLILSGVFIASGW
jgi:curved DNA-binding protein CbpA